jgi:DNA repair protein RadC
MESWDLDSIEHIEEFKLMLMTRSNKVLGIASISKGGISGIVTDGKQRFIVIWGNLMHLLNF